MIPNAQPSEIVAAAAARTLRGTGQHALAVDTLKNFATLIDRYGHIPNGNRTYYLSRSQPPFFAQMVGLIANEEGDRVYLQYLPELQAEYTYWMDGSDKLAPGHAYRPEAITCFAVLTITLPSRGSPSNNVCMKWRA